MNSAMSYPNGASSNATSFNPVAPSPTKPLWAVIGVLGMCVLAMGASLVSIHKRSIDPTAGSFNAMRFAGMGNGAMITESADGKPLENSSEALQSSAPAAAKNTAKPAAAKVQTKPTNTKASLANGAQPPAEQAAQPVVTQAPVQAKSICTSCGTVEAVTPVTRPGKGSGVGMVAGGVLGGVLGNQVGSGNGRTAATVLGAVGGGWAGNAVEKNMKKDTVYSVRVRMEDGSSRTLEQASAPAVGGKVTAAGNTLRSSGGEVYAPAPEQRARAPQIQPQRDVYNTGG
jgi:outer membrane lipoprotein SlyB